MMNMYPNFTLLREAVKLQFKNDSVIVKGARWQGIETKGRPDLETYEILNHSSTVRLPTEDLSYYRAAIKPDTPWADDHFEERVCGYPLNPGTEWAKWRMGRGADQFRLADGTFNHNYMERLWPKYARMVPPADKRPDTWLAPGKPHTGILYEYGDLEDLADLLAREPDTRQAYLPLWFPEDTGVVHGDRAPCSLGWHFIVRNNQLHVVYYLRSVDLMNHWRNDLYMAVRLLLWVLTQCRTRSEFWNSIIPGTLTTHITSFHCFRGNWHQLETL